MKRDMQADRLGSVPIDLTPPMSYGGGALAQLYVGHEHMLAPVPPEVDDEDMSCGGRDALHERRKTLAYAKKDPLPCAQCIVRETCDVFLARMD